MSVPATSLHFGDVWESNTVELTIPVTNTSTEVAEIERWQLSCDCQSVDPVSLVIAPNATENIRLRLTMKPRSGADLNRQPKQQRHTIRPLLKNAQSPHPSFEITGATKPYISAPFTYDYPAFSVLAQPFANGTIDAQFDVPVTAVTVTAAYPIKEAQIVPSTTKNGFQIVLQWHEQFAEGEYPFVLSVNARAENMALPEWKIRGTLVVVPDVKLSRSQVFFDSKHLTSTEQVEVVSLTKKKLMIRRLEGDSLNKTIGGTIVNATQLRLSVLGKLATLPTSQNITIIVESEKKEYRLPLTFIISE